MKDPLDQFRAMLDPKNWPLKDDDAYLIIKGEIYCYARTGNPFEQRTFKPLYQGRFQ